MSRALEPSLEEVVPESREPVPTLSGTGSAGSHAYRRGREPVGTATCPQPHHPIGDPT